MVETAVRAAVPQYNTPYAIVSTSRGYVVRSVHGHELSLHELCVQETFEVISSECEMPAGTHLYLNFYERGGPYFTTESGEEVDLQKIAEKVMLLCVTQPDK